MPDAPGAGTRAGDTTIDWYDEVYDDRVRFGLAVKRRLLARDSPLQRVEILDTVHAGRVLVIDGVFMTSEADEFLYHEMIAHPALVTAPTIRRVLIIGGGDGGTAREVLRHRGVEHVRLVEIDGVVVEACRAHMPDLGAWDDPRLTVDIGDGIAFVKEAEVEPYDVVILDGTDPVGPGEGLFDLPFFRGVRRVLAPDGVFVMQSESPLLMRAVFDDIQRTLGQVFPRVRPYFGPVPLYAAGIWSWTYASASADPLALDDERARAIAGGCRYYNPEIHRGAFARPSFLVRSPTV